MTCRHTTCRHCGQDIEGFSPYRAGEWRDRGNNPDCPDGSGRMHAPVIETTTMHTAKYDRDAHRAAVEAGLASLPDYVAQHATRRESERGAVRTVAECVRGREQELIPAAERAGVAPTLAELANTPPSRAFWGSASSFLRDVASMTPYEPGSTADFEDAMATMNHLIERAQKILAGLGLQGPKK